MPTTPASEIINGTKVLHLGNDVEIKLFHYMYYPMWFWVVIAVGFMFCTISCAVWFFCAMYRLRKEKPCNHPVYEARTVINKDGEEKPDLKTQKSEKHCKKVGALSEAESLAKSFKSVRSKKSTKSAKSSKKSTKSKKSSKEHGDDNDDKPRNEENHDEQGGDQGHKDDNGNQEKSKASRKSSRKDGGRDDMCVVEIDGNSGKNQEPSVFKTLANRLFFSKN